MDLQEMPLIANCKGITHSLNPLEKLILSIYNQALTENEQARFRKHFAGHRRIRFRKFFRYLFGHKIDFKVFYIYDSETYKEDIRISFTTRDQYYQQTSSKTCVNIT